MRRTRGSKIDTENELFRPQLLLLRGYLGAYPFLPHPDRRTELGTEVLHHEYRRISISVSPFCRLGQHLTKITGPLSIRPGDPSVETFNW
jgi:hypothetical protein